MYFLENSFGVGGWFSFNDSRLVVATVPVFTMIAFWLLGSKVGSEEIV